MIDITKFLAVINAAVENPIVQCPQFLVIRKPAHRDDFVFEAFMGDRENMRLMLYSVSENSGDVWVVVTLHWYDDGVRVGEAWNWQQGREARMVHNYVRIGNAA